MDKNPRFYAGFLNGLSAVVRRAGGISDLDGAADTMNEAADVIRAQYAEGAAKDETLADILKFIDAQAEDRGLWCEPCYASEAYIQRGLRGCHAYIESRIKDGPPASTQQEPDEKGQAHAD